MKSVEIGKVKTHLQKTPFGYSVTRGVWSCVNFDNYEDASEYWDKFCPDSE